MATKTLNLHAITPELNKVKQVAEALSKGSVILYPGDTGFMLGCQLSNKDAISRLRLIRQLPEGKALTFMCENLATISEFARVSNAAYRAIKALIPGPYTFILPASRQVPRFAQDERRRTAGIRVPEGKICQALLRELGSPIVTISARPTGSTETWEETVERLRRQVDLVIDTDSYDFKGESTVIDMTGDEFEIVRSGAGIERALDFIPDIAAA